MRNALPCIVCGAELHNVDETATNQPHEGTAFQSHGHYGSTFWDPMDGQYIEINVCDECLKARQDRIMMSRDRKPCMCEGTVVGWTMASRPLVPYSDEGVDDFGDDALHFDLDEVGNSELYPEVKWIPAAVKWAKAELN